MYHLMQIIFQLPFSADKDEPQTCFTIGRTSLGLQAGWGWWRRWSPRPEGNKYSIIEHAFPKSLCHPSMSLNMINQLVSRYLEYVFYRCKMHIVKSYTWNKCNYLFLFYFCASFYTVQVNYGP